ncbi:MAG: preprotein translocase subunit YajC [Prevotellaceae bacterium]|jgi:preprotein translocase subunit YajC|nr:preprotein translocase subunit YajC [Prevotellaceae bacterium]
MNPVLLQDAAAAAGATGGMGSNMTSWMMIIAIIVVMYFFMIRPQQKRQKELRKFRESLQKGDKVITTGGIYGTVSEIKEGYVLIEVDNNIRLRFDKSSVLKDASDMAPAK